VALGTPGKEATEKTMSVVVIDLGEEGRNYVVENLNGWDSVTKNLSAQFANGRAFALLPEDTSLARATDFRTGGLLLGLKPSRWIAQRCFASRRANKNCALLVEDTIARRGDPNIAVETANKFFLNTRVFYFLNAEDFADKSIIDILHVSRGFDVIGFLSKMTLDRAPLLNQEISPGLLTTVVQNIQEIYISAYDGESFVLWIRG
jgi:hypothetical protein